MKKVKIGTVAEELKMDINELIKLKSDKLKPDVHYTGYGKNTLLTEKAIEIIKLSLAIPLAVPNRIEAVVLREAKNPRWIYAKLNGSNLKVPVAIPRKLRGKLVGKRIYVDAITDASNATTYRHELLGD